MKEFFMAFFIVFILQSVWYNLSGERDKARNINKAISLAKWYIDRDMTIIRKMQVALKDKNLAYTKAFERALATKEDIALGKREVYKRAITEYREEMLHYYASIRDNKLAREDLIDPRPYTATLGLIIWFILLASNAKGIEAKNIVGEDTVKKLKAKKVMTKAEYRAKAKKLHPDMGGSVEAMQELNKQYKEEKL